MLLLGDTTLLGKIPSSPFSDINDAGLSEHRADGLHTGASGE